MSTVEAPDAVTACLLAYLLTPPFHALLALPLCTFPTSPLLHATLHLQARGHVLLSRRGAVTHLVAFF